MKNHRMVRTRSAWARIQEIHQRIENGSYPNCVGLAGELEVSLATLKRDLEFMRDRLRLPIAYDPRQHGYYFHGPVQMLATRPALSEGERFALVVADKAVAQYPGTEFQQVLRLMSGKLAGTTGPEPAFPPANLAAVLSFRPLGAEAADGTAFRALTRAVRERRVVLFQYRNLGMRGARQRRVRPYHLACIDNHWYLFAHDLRRRALRTFALSRLRSPELTGERFAPPRDFSPDRYLAGSFGVLKGQCDYEVVVEFDAWATDLLRGRRWHPSQRLTEVPGGGSRLGLRLTCLDEIERWLLSWGAHATILRPQALIDRVLRTAQLLRERYSTA